MFQPRDTNGAFTTNGASPHEKHRFHLQQAHIFRVSAAIALHNGDYSQAETHDASAAAHDKVAAAHLVTALKT